MRLLYLIASTLLFVLLAPLLLVHRKTRGGWLERLGFYRGGALAARPGGPRIWLHGASAGDVLALAPLVDRLRVRFPNAVLFLTTLTNTGRQMATERLRGKVDTILYAPWDLWGATRRAVRAIRPDLLVLEYAEIWPNLLRATHGGGARIALNNGRFAPEKLRNYRWLFGAIGNPLRDIDCLLMRDGDEAARAELLGAPVERVRVTGNTKFDASVPRPSPADVDGLRERLGLRGDERVWMAGSTHEGEEALLFDVFVALRRRAPDLRLVLAPRYVDRAPRVAALAQRRGLSVGRYSEGPAPAASVLVVDQIGLLTRLYALATVVFVGGSFSRRGGHNLLEPAAQGRPVLFGPDTRNVSDTVKVLEGNGGLQVQSAAELERTMGDLLDDPARMAALGAQAMRAVAAAAGAADRNVQALAELLSSRGAG